MISLAIAGNPPTINFAIFVAVFSFLSLLVLLPSAIMGLMAGTPIPLVLDVLNTFFFFCGAVALSAQLGVHSCGDDGYTKGNKITNGALDRGKRCREAQASTAFMWFAFFTYAVSMVFSAMTARSSGVNLRGSGIRKGMF